MDIGQYNRLRINQITAEGLVLDSGSGTTVILPSPQKQSSAKSKPSTDPWAAGNSETSATTEPQAGQWLEVFVYTNANGEPIITTDTPRVTAGDCAVLEVVSRSSAGIWLDWGLPQDLLLPVSEQTRSADTRTSDDSGPHSVFVYVFLDEKTNRLCATTRLHRYLQEYGDGLRQWQKVNLIIAERTQLGFKAVINKQYLGLLYADEVFQTLEPGDRIDGYIKSLRPDGKIDLTLYARPSELKDELGQRILKDLELRGGESTLTDKSPPEEIYQRFQVSKKNYKRALGNLYKARLISIDPHRITLVR